MEPTGANCGILPVAMGKKISIVLPVYNEAGTMAPLYEEISKVTKTMPEYAFECVFVNDGSKDGSAEAIKKLPAKGPAITLINFSRNFGHQIAVTAGMDYADGDAVIIMDSDLQDPPEVMPELLDAWEKGAQVVYATRRSRKDTFFKKVTAHAFYRLINMMSDVPIPVDTGDFRLLDKQVIKEVRRFPEHARFLRGISSFVGFKQTRVLFDRRDRTIGETKYPFKKMVKFSIDAITGFSTVPLKIIGKVGFVVSLLSFVGIVYALVAKFFFVSTVVQGWTFTAISVLFIGGIQMIMLGIIGSYIGRIYDEVRARPLYIISETEKVHT